jgi:hypothetical protein
LPHGLVTLADERGNDTGALVSLLDRAQRLHRECTELFDRWRAPVVSTDLTTDRDFAVYRYGRDRSFNVLPS